MKIVKMFGSRTSPQFLLRYRLKMIEQKEINAFVIFTYNTFIYNETLIKEIHETNLVMVAVRAKAAT